MKNMFYRLGWFSIGLSVGLAIGAISFSRQQKIESFTQTNIAITATSNTNRASNVPPQKLDWFKDNSNYIWDGWKIK